MRQRILLHEVLEESRVSRWRCLWYLDTNLGGIAYLLRRLLVGVTAHSCVLAPLPPANPVSSRHRLPTSQSGKPEAGSRKTNGAGRSSRVAAAPTGNHPSSHALP